MKLQINLPNFCGFYGSQLDLDGLFETSEDIENYGDYPAEDEDKIDWIATMTELAKDYLDEFWEQNKDYLTSAGIKSMTFVELDSPQFYNYTTDKIALTVEFNSHTFRAFIKSIVAQRPLDFAEFVKDKYSSYSGFHSFYSNEVDVWLGEYLRYKLTSDNVVFEGFLEFLLTCDSPEYNEQSIIDRVYEQKHSALTYKKDAA